MFLGFLGGFDIYQSHLVLLIARYRVELSDNFFLQFLGGLMPVDVLC